MSESKPEREELSQAEQVRKLRGLRHRIQDWTTSDKGELRATREFVCLIRDFMHAACEVGCKDRLALFAPRDEMERRAMEVYQFAGEGEVEKATKLLRESQAALDKGDPFGPARREWGRMEAALRVGIPAKILPRPDYPRELPNTPGVGERLTYRSRGFEERPDNWPELTVRARALCTLWFPTDWFLSPSIARQWKGLNYPFFGTKESVAAWLNYREHYMDVSIAGGWDPENWEAETRHNVALLRQHAPHLLPDATPAPAVVLIPHTPSLIPSVPSAASDLKPATDAAIAAVETYKQVLATALAGQSPENCFERIKTHLSAWEAAITAVGDRLSDTCNEGFVFAGERYRSAHHAAVEVVGKLYRKVTILRSIPNYQPPPLAAEPPAFDLHWLAQEIRLEALRVQEIVHPQYVTLDQAAALVPRSKKTLERYKNDPNKNFPKPAIEGGGGKPAEWIWSELRPWLEKEFGRKLPEVYPERRDTKGH